MDNIDIEDLESVPTVTLSAESDKLGIITSISLGASSLFGYNKNELINRKVNTIMPEMLA